MMNGYQSFVDFANSEELGPKCEVEDDRLLDHCNEETVLLQIPQRRFID